ncbi:hypothetical protein FDECE_8117 [Fusarium decemcellulare]|nr:hypothetical protein FDECE_8117 [Fusarium decemcellulare]
MHRDIRPHNVVIDHEHRKLRLIGWSSSAFYRHGQEHNLRVGLFKAPEVLVSNERYDPKIDMWCFGAMLASMMFRKEPFFHGNSISDQLDKIARVLGTDRLYDYVDKYQIELDEYIIEVLGEYLPRPWSSFVNSDNEHLVTDDSLHLLDQLLRFDPEVSQPPRMALSRELINLTGAAYGFGSLGTSILPKPRIDDYKEICHLGASKKRGRGLYYVVTLRSGG